jgi:hypothetical protein
MVVDQSRQRAFSLEIDDRRLWTNVRLHPAIVADREEFTLLYGDGGCDRL